MFDRMSPNINMKNSNVAKICQYQDACRDFNLRCKFCENNEMNKKKSYFKQIVPTTFSVRMGGSPFDS